jgi:hypothetical protein
MTSAAEATFDKARPMYKALDDSLTGVPDTLGSTSKVVQQAITRAEKLGIQVTHSPGGLELIDQSGAVVDRGTVSPMKLEDGLKSGRLRYEEISGKQPITTYMKVRSELLKMQRASSDPATSFAIGGEIRSMNNAMDEALEGTPLHENWLEANRLWSKGYAIREVADSLNDTVKGTPPSVQAEGLEKIPTKVSASSLVEKLNDLDRNGTLDRAFSRKEASNLRKAADILDRAQKTPISKSESGGFSFFKGLASAARGNALPLAGAAAGYVTGGLRGAEYGAGLGFIVQEVGMRSLINAMTRIEGVNALNSLSRAQNPATAARALQTLKAIGVREDERQQKQAARDIVDGDGDGNGDGDGGGQQP